MFKLGETEYHLETSVREETTIHVESDSIF
jgi:hypothetical protein